MRNIHGQFKKGGIFLLFCLFAMTARSQDGYWQRYNVKDTMTDVQKLIRNTYKNFNLAHHKFSAQTGDMGLSFEYNYYSTIDKKDHIRRGHVAWEWTNPSTMTPGEKLTVRGIVSNLTAESGNVSAYVKLSSFGFMKPEPGKLSYAKPNGTTIMAGTAEVPKPGIDRNGKLIPYLYLKFVLSGGNNFTWVERTITYTWIPKKTETNPPATGSNAIAGTYKTDFNEMTLSITGNKVTGTYKWNNGKIEGTLNGMTLTGWWFQSNGKGRFVFNFNSNFTAFTGKWGYNESEPTSQWNGTKVSGQ
ncbi:MAG: hypothetical protein HZB42_10590 [Sphingobacteriales bacterium]|nr:hypothetical protein [Sphingobacteriales bacterium]